MNLAQYNALTGDRKSAYGYKWEFIAADPMGHLNKFLKGE